MQSDRPAAEVEIATRFPAAAMHLIVVSDAEPATLAISDWSGTRRYPLARFAAGRAGGQIVHPPPRPGAGIDSGGRRRSATRSVSCASPWRPRTRGRSLCASAISEETAPQEEGFSRQSAPIVLPAQAMSGSRTIVPLRVRNTGSWTWSPAQVTPVQIGARFVPVAAGGRERGPARVLPRPVAAGETLDTAVALEWPAVPGRYRVSLDLVLEDVAWFAEKVGAPLGSGEVEVSER